MMNRILIDVGNTRTKCVLAEGEALVARRRLATAALTPDSVEKVTAEWDAEEVVMCSVVPEKDVVFHEVFGARLLVVSWEIPLGIGIDYPEPATIGADRLANAAALARCHGAPGVVVDFGTAVTFDVVSAAGAYCGGVIAPGVEMMNNYMSERTALLPRVDLVKSPPVLGRSTVEAMQAGAYYGYSGMVRRILDELAGALGGEEKVTMVATGGAGALFHGELGVDLYEPDLTLHGLRLIAEAQPSPSP